MSGPREAVKVLPLPLGTPYKFGKQSQKSQNIAVEIQFTCIYANGAQV